MVEGDLTPLIITGLPQPLDLRKAWADIEEAFLDMIKDKDGLYKIRLLNKVNNLKVNFRFAHLCIEFLSLAHHPSIEESLKRIVRIDAQLDAHDRGSYMRLLQTAKNRVQRIEIDMETAEAEYALINKGNATNTKVTYQHFDRMVASVSHYMKFRIDKKKITIGEFGSYYGLMREHSDHISSLSKKRSV